MIPDIKQSKTRGGKNRLLCWCILLISGIIYGSSFSWMKVAVNEGANPLAMVFWLTLLASVVLLIEVIISGHLGQLKAIFLAFCVPWSILSLILPNLFFFYAATEIEASLIAMGIALVPILTLTGAVLLKRERVTFRRSMGIAMGAIGILMIVLPETSLPEAGDTFFVVIAFLGAACYAAEHLYIESHFPVEARLDQLLFLMFCCATLILFPIVLFTDTLILPQYPLGKMELAILGVTAVTLLDYFLITILILWAGPVFTSQTAYVVTLAGVMWGIIIFGDTHSGWIWTALFMLIVGTMLVRPRDEFQNTL